MICQGIVREMSGNFEPTQMWQPWRNMLGQIRDCSVVAESCFESQSKLAPYFLLIIELQTKKAASPQNEAGLVFTQCSAEIINEINHKKLTVRDILESEWMGLSGSVWPWPLLLGESDYASGCDGDIMYYLIASWTGWEWMVDEDLLLVTVLWLRTEQKFRNYVFLKTSLLTKMREEHGCYPSALNYFTQFQISKLVGSFEKWHGFLVNWPMLKLLVVHILPFNLDNL